MMNPSKINTVNSFTQKPLSKAFSTSSKSTSKTFYAVLLGGGICGMAYLTHNMSRGSVEHTRALLQNDSYSNHLVRNRTKDTMCYFAGGLVFTGTFLGLMLRSPKILAMSCSPWSLLFSLPTTIACMCGVRYTDTKQENRLTKNLCFAGFNGAMGFSLLPIIAMTSLPIIRDAFLLTSGVFGGLGYTAYMARDDAFLGMHGVLGAGLGGLIAVSFANMFFQNQILFNIWLWGGMALFVGFTLYDIKEIQIKAMKASSFDPMSESIGVYLDFINIFVRMIYILQGRKK